MKITGLVTEYNPFHLGHNYHLNKAKEDTNCDAIVAIMSGNFMQRGNPALIDKFNRAEIAVKNGVDLVLELPLVYSISSAETFAFGAVSILNKLGVIDYLYFGSEEGNISTLKEIASILVDEPASFKQCLKENLNLGLPYHISRKYALEKVLPNSNIGETLNNSNNILGIEYLKALKLLNSSIIPYTLKRVGSNYNDKELNEIFSSATSIRKTLEDGAPLENIKSSISENTFNTLESLKSSNYTFTFPESIFPYLKYKILTNPSQLSNILDVKEGLDNKIVKSIYSSNNLNNLIFNIKSKRYTYTRLNRILSSFFIGLENYNLENLIKETPNYIRPLAFNEKGCKILKQIKNKENINIITKVPKTITNPYLEIDLLGTKSYSLINPSTNPLDDYLKSPKLFKNN